MPSLIRPSRAEVSRNFPVLGFTVRTGNPAWFEVALATDPELFSPSAKSRRTARNFFSTRGMGPLPAEHGEAVFLVPSDALAKFAGQGQLFYALATFRQPDRQQPELTVPPPSGAPSVAISGSFSGTTRRLKAFGPGTGRRAPVNGNSYSNQQADGLEWAGDTPLPGTMQPVSTGPSTDVQQPIDAEVPAKASSFEYSDGYGAMPEEESQRSGALAVVEVASAIAGAVMTRILDNEGDISWELDQLDGLKYPGNDAGNVSGDTFVTSTLTVPGPRTATVASFDEIYADSEITFQYDGRALGNIQIAVVKSNDAYGQGLRVKAQIINEANPYRAPESSTLFAAVKVRFHYRFTSPLQDDAIAITDLVLYGNGAWSRTSRWTTGAVGSLPDDIVADVVTAQGYPIRPLELQSFDVFWPDVELIPQSANDTCWAAAAAMVAGWAGMQSIPPNPGPEGYEGCAARFDLVMEPARSYGIDGFRRQLETHGPIFVAAVQPFPSGHSYHAVTVVGIHSDGAPDSSDTWVHVHDPWDRLPGSPGAPGAHTGTHHTGSRYTQRWADFVAEYQAVPRDPTLHPLQVMYARAGTSGRRPVIGPEAHSLALSAQRNGHQPSRPRQLNEGKEVPFVVDDATLRRIAGSEGGNSWELEQLIGLKHPHNVSPTDLRPLQTTSVSLPGPRWHDIAGGESPSISNEIIFEHDGRSLGNIRISANNLNAPGSSLFVRAMIMNEPLVYSGPEGGPMAAVKIELSYERSTVGTQNRQLAECDVTLYANGDYTSTYRWVSNAGGELPPPHFAEGITALHEQDPPPQAAIPQVAFASSQPAPSFDIYWPDVPLIPKSTYNSCRAAAAAMVAGWAGLQHIPAGDRSDSNQEIAERWGLTIEPPQKYSIDAFRTLLTTRGPLSVAAAQPAGSGNGDYAVVVTGMYSAGGSDGSDTYVRVNDPENRESGSPGDPGAYTVSNKHGSTYTQRWADFISKYQTAPSDDHHNQLEIVHAGGTDGRSPTTGASALALGRSRPVARPAAVVEIGSAVVGAVMTRILDNQGDISWELDQLRGLKYPRNDANNASGDAFTTTTVAVPGPRTSTVFGVDEIYANSEILFQHDGRALGNIQIAVTRSNDAAGQGLVVKAQVMDEANVYQATGSTTTMAAVKVRFHYRFTSPIQDDAIAITDLMLFGNGTWSRTSRWTEE